MTIFKSKTLVVSLILSVNIFLTKMIQAQEGDLYSKILEFNGRIPDSIKLSNTIPKIGSLDSINNKSSFIYNNGFSNYLGISYGNSSEYSIYFIVDYSDILISQAFLIKHLEYFPLIGILVYSKQYNQFCFLDYSYDPSIGFSSSGHLIPEVIQDVRTVNSISVVDKYFNFLYTLEFNQEEPNRVLAEYIIISLDECIIRVSINNSIGLDINEIISANLFSLYLVSP